jgi:hypothetical protein
MDKRNSDTPTPTDSLEEAEEKSKTVDERVPEVIPPHDDPPGPGEVVLDNERKAVRQPPRS